MSRPEGDSRSAFVTCWAAPNEVKTLVFFALITHIPHILRSTKRAFTFLKKLPSCYVPTPGFTALFLRFPIHCWKFAFFQVPQSSLKRSSHLKNWINFFSQLVQNFNHFLTYVVFSSLSFLHRYPIVAFPFFWICISGFRFMSQHQLFLRFCNAISGYRKFAGVLFSFILLILTCFLFLLFSQAALCLLSKISDFISLHLCVFYPHLIIFNSIVFAPNFQFSAVKCLPGAVLEWTLGFEGLGV